MSSTPGKTASGASPADLVRVAVYRRTVRASLERVWENVLDWEHLPWLHRGAFKDIQMLKDGPSGWLARAITTRERELLLELRIEREGSRYVARTLEGDGAGTEIWTHLRPRAEHETDIEVEFHVPGVPVDGVEAIGAAYTHIYTELWDEDETMMREREVRLTRQRSVARADFANATLSLGKVDAVRAQLPMQVEFAGEPVWLVERNGSIAAHTAVCPHLLGPLPPAGLEEDQPATTRCPWHGYRFDTGRRTSCDGKKFRLSAPPEVVLEDGDILLVAPTA